MQQILSKTLPKTYKAVCVTAYDQPMTVQELPMPTLSDEGDLLIKVEAGAISIVDDQMIKGQFPKESGLPFTPGDEGSGIVIDGYGQKAKSMIGKKVSFIPKISSNTGSYGQYCVSNTLQTMVVDNDLEFDQAAAGSLNPFTCVLMYKKTKNLQAKAIINTTAAGQLGRQIQNYFTKNGIQVINIVRRQEQVDILKGLGAKYVLNSTSDKFQEELKQIAGDLQATVAFDAVFGKLSKQILDCMPQKSHLFVYDGVSQETSMTVSLDNLLVERKNISYFIGYDEYFGQSEKEIEEQQKIVSANLKTDLSSVISKSFTYEQANEAFEYYFKNMTKGKPIIKYQI